MSASLDLLEKIEMYSQAAAEAAVQNVDTQKRLANSMEQLAAGAAGGDGGGGGSSTKVDVKSLGEIGMSVKEFADGIVDAMPKLKKADKHMERMANSIAKFVVTLSEGVGDKDAVENALAGVAVITGLAGSLLRFVGQVALATPLLIIISPLIPILAMILGGFVRMLALFAGKKAKQAQEFGESLEALGSGIFNFAWKVALAGPLLILAIPALVLFAFASLLIMGISKLIMSQEKNIDKAGNLIREMGIAILIFTAAVALSMIIMSTMGMEDAGKFLILLIAIGLTALAFALVGKFGKQITKGIIAVFFMSIALVVFALGVMLANMMMPGFVDTLMLALSVVVIALVFYLAGMFFQNILMGSIAMILVGVALIIMGLGVRTMGGIIAENPNLLWQIPVLIIGLGLAFAAAGIPVVAAFIALGAGVLMIAGAALIAIGLGVQAILKPLKDADEDQIYNIERVLKAVINGFGKGFEDLSLTQALTLPLKIPLVGLMGLALWGLGKGLNAYMKTAGDWEQEDTELLKGTISGISEAFATAGSTEGMSSLFGFNVGKNDTERGIESTMKMGRNLRKLSEGIAAWQKLELDRETMGEIKDNIMLVLNTIPGVFASIGKREKESKGSISFLGISFTNPFEQGDIEAGIKATRKIGGVLESLAKGIEAWKKLEMDRDVMQVITDNVTMVLNTIPGVFASIGKREKGSKGKTSFFGIEMTNPFEQGDIEAGIDSVKNLGGTLKDLADGVKAWKDDPETMVTPEDIQMIQQNVAAVLDAIPSVFAAIGNKEKDSQGFFGWGEGDIEAGIGVIEPLGKTMKDLSEGVLAFRTGGENGFQPGELQEIRGNIAATLSTIPAAFAKVGQGEVLSIKDNWDDMLSGKKPFKFSKIGEGNIESGIKLVKKMISPLESITDLLVKVAKKDAVAATEVSEAQPGFGGLGSAGSSLGKSIYALFGWISKAFNKFKIESKHAKTLKKLVDPVEDLTDVLPKVNKEFEIHFKFLSDLDKKTVDLFAQWADALTVMSKVDTTKVEKSGFFSKLLTEKGAEMQEGSNLAGGGEGGQGQGGGANKDKKKDVSGADIPTDASASDSAMITVLNQILQAMNSLAQSQAAQQGELVAIKQKLGTTLKVREIE